MPDLHLLPDSAAASTEPSFECSRAEGALDAAWVHVTGALDIATTPRLERTLRESQSNAQLVVLDLRELVFMDCAGVHAIVDASSRARQAGRRLLLVRGPRERRSPLRTDRPRRRGRGRRPRPGPSPFNPHQRALVSSSLLKTGDGSHSHARSRRP